MATLAELEAREQDLMAQLITVRADIAKWHFDDIWRRTGGLKIGAIVHSTDARKAGRDYRVVDISEVISGTLWVDAVPRRKDGKWGVRKVWLGSDWELVGASDDHDH